MLRMRLAAALVAAMASSRGAYGQSDESELEAVAPTPEGMFNAALGMPVVADSEYSAPGSCPLVDGSTDCVASLAVDGFIGNEHRWLSTRDDSLHWLIVDLQAVHWIEVANIFAGYDASAADGTISTADTTYGLCDYDLQVLIGRPPECGVDCPDQFQERAWRTVVHVDAANEPTSEESHDSFAPTRGRFWRLKIDQSTCPTDNIARLYELQLLAPIPGRACEKTVKVTNAGAVRVNGIYYQDGTSNGATRYTKSGTSISLLSWPDGNWYISELRGGAGGERTPGDGDDIDYYISAIQDGAFAGTPPTTGWTVPSYSNPTQIPQGAGTGFGTYPAPTLDVDACDGAGENPQLVFGNPTSDRQTPDGASAIQFVDRTLVFQSNGNVRTWDIYVGRPGSGWMQVWRPMVANAQGDLVHCNPNHRNCDPANPTCNPDCVATTTWRLQCSQPFTATTHGPVHIAVSAENRCNFAKGDAVGWSHAGQGVIDFDYGQGGVRAPGETETSNKGNNVLWHYGGPPGGQFDGATLGQDIDFDGSNDGGRIYSVAATVRYSVQRETCAPVQSMKTCAELNAEAEGNGQIAWVVDVDSPNNELGTSERESRRVCGASQDGVYLNCDSASFPDAIHMCFAAGARLCTMEEILHDETHTTGCMFDTQRVWSSTRSGCPEGQARTLAGASGAIDQFPQECTPITQVLPVRCCADIRPLCQDGTPCHPSASLLTCGELSWEETQGFGGASVCAESDDFPEGCTNDVTFEQAANICLGAGARLCTVAEIQAHETRNTGCMFNYEYIWTSEQDECQVNQIMTMTGSGTTRVMPGNTYPPAPPTCEDIFQGTAAVSCCADASTKCGEHDPESCRDMIVSMWGMCDRGSCGSTCREAVRTAADATGCFDGTCAFDSHEWAVEQMAQTCQMDDIFLQPCNAGPVLDYDHTEVAYWSFDDGTAIDLVGDHDGELTGGVTSEFDRERGYVMEFDGRVGSYIEVPPSDSFDLTEFSFFAWMKREDVAAIGVNDVAADDPNGNGVLLAHGQGFGSAPAYDCSRPTGHLDADSIVCCPASCRGCGGSRCELRPGGASQCCTSEVSQNGVTCGENGGAPPCNMPTAIGGTTNDKLQYEFQLHANHVRVYMEASDGSFHNIDGQTTIQPGVWTHVGFTLNRGFRTNSYINGETDSPSNARLPRFDIPGLDHIITIGARTELTPGGGHRYVNNFQGALDDVRLFNSAVAPNFVNALYGQLVVEAQTLGATGVCDSTQTLARLANLIAHCCDDAGEVCANEDGVEGPPDSCSPTCASMYLPFYEDCGHVLPSLFDENGVHANLGGAFTEQIVMAPWRQFYEICEVHSGGTGNPHATHVHGAVGGCDMDAINTACADQSQLQNQQLTVLCRTPCVTTIVANYDSCSNDPTNDEFVDNLEPLMQLCAGDITTRRCYDLFQSFEENFPLSCCSNGVCPTTDPTTGAAFFLPNRCSPVCAELFMPLFSSCAETLWGNQPAQFNEAVNFEEKCAAGIGRYVGDDGFDPCHGIPCGQCNDRNDDTGSGFGFQCGWCSHNGGFCSSTCTTEPGACAAVDPNNPDTCSDIDSCIECTGSCGWCKDGDDNSVCSRECVTTAQECAFEGCGHTQWKVEYFANNALQGEPEKTICSARDINIHWGERGVMRLGGQSDQFSVRWTGSFAFYPGTYTWADRSDDGSRLYLDGALVMDHWGECCATWTSSEIAVSEGNHAVVFEYEENSGLAYVSLNHACSCRRCFWERPQVTTNTRRGDNSGTSCNIFITIIGENGYTDEKLLRSGMRDGQSETGTVDVCDIECAERIGTITNIQLRTDCSDGWKFDSVELYMPNFKKYTFGGIDDARTGANFIRRVNSLDIEESDGVASIQVQATEVPPPAGHPGVRITFEPPDSPSPHGYEKDSGQLFGPQPTQFMPSMPTMNYGWSCDLNADGNDFRDREIFADQVLDTLVVLDRDGNCPGDAVQWEIELPNGEYTVTVGYSDPAYHVITDGCMLEGESASVGVANGPAEYTRTLMLSDGRLTFSGKYDGVDAKCEDISYIIITPGADDMGPGHCEFPRCAVGSYEANYWANTELEGAYSAAACETGPDISYDWGYDQGPQQLVDVHAAINEHITSGVSDEFSARWVGMFNFPDLGAPGPSYQFSLRSDDGSRLWFDDKLMMDHWHDCCHTWLSDPVTVHTHFPSHPTQHRVELHMQEDGGNAYVDLSWTQVQSPCESGWYAYDGMCWYLSSNHVPWGDEMCPPGSNLASLHDEDHLRFARGIGNDCIASGDEVSNRFCRMWVGLTDGGSECGSSWDCEGWAWTDGSPYDYTFWGPGQPNDNEYSANEQDCGYLNPDYNWLIGDEDCGAETDGRDASNWQWRSLCQKPYRESLDIAGFALWDQWCIAQTDAQQDNAMDMACANKYEGSRAASTDEIIELLGGQTMSSHPSMASEHPPGQPNVWNSYPGLTYECLMGTCHNGECYNTEYPGNTCLDNQCRRCTASGEGVIVADPLQWDAACGSWDATGRRGALCVIPGSGGTPGGGH